MIDSTMTTIGPPHSAGPEPNAEAIRQRQLEQARRAGWPELNRDDLVFHRYGVVEHEPTGRFFVVHRGELTDSIYTAAVAFFVGAAGTLVYLERPTSFPGTRAELEQRQADRERRRNAPRPRRR